MNNSKQSANNLPCFGDTIDISDAIKMLHSNHLEPKKIEEPFDEEEPFGEQVIEFLSSLHLTQEERLKIIHYLSSQ